jgi:hypothetical protein
MKNIRFTLIFGIFCALLNSCSTELDYRIIISPDADPSEVLAAKEIRRYYYLRTDNLLPVIQSDQLQPGNNIVLAVKDQELLKEYVNLDPSVYSDLKEQEFVLKSVQDANRTIHFIIGGDIQGVLYGAYQFAEEMGVRFYLHGDVIPDESLKTGIPVLNEKGSPRFELRGILPFHDFPEGPDWWNLEEYKAVIAQLVRLKMNFVGFHTYPEVKDYPSGYCQAEPLVWIGPEQDIKDDGSVTSAYPVLHFNTRDNTWGYNPMQTSEFHCGAAELFEEDYFGASYMMNASLWPRPEADNIRVFNEVGDILNNAFSFARKLDVKTCIGTETMLTIPEILQNRFTQDKKLSGNNLVKEMYRGIFHRITLLHPLDYYWLWTPENWTWSGTTPEEIRNTEDDMLKALSALKEINAPFTLATCGWVLGPPGDRTRFDKLLPKDIPFSCINREVGFSPVEPSFADLSGRPKWAIPWMEDDPDLVSPQLWAGRMRKDAQDALKYGCTGLMGIHWRTKILGPTVSALAAAGWDIKSLEEKDLYSDIVSKVESERSSGAGGRDLPVDDFYGDWAKCQFGSEASEEIAGIFTSVDGGPIYIKEKDPMRSANLYRFADWQGGPGGILVNKQPWDEISRRYEFVDKLEKIRVRVKGKGNLERFDYWLNTFRYARSAAHFGCIMGQVDKIVSSISGISDESIKKGKIVHDVLPLRIQAAMTWVEMMDYLLKAVSTTGEMGTVANLEQHNLGLLGLLNKYDSLIIDATGKSLPPEAELSMKYFGQLRIIVPALRNILEADEDFNLKIIILSGEPVREASFYWKNLGEKKFHKLPLNHINRGVYKVTLSQDVLKNSDFEYYIEAISASSGRTIFPVTAPEINQTVITNSTNIK